MTKNLLTVAFLFCLSTAYAQTKAITDNGEEVILNKDGTWKYANLKPSYTTRLDTLSFVKDKDATFLLKGKNIKYGVYLNPKKWKFEAVNNNESAHEYFLTLKDGDAFAMIIPERVELTFELLEQVALENAQNAAPDIHITKQEMRTINGNLVKVMEMQGTLKGVSFVYFGYYYVGPLGTIQFISYTTKGLYKEYLPEMEKLLNGFTLIN